MNDSNKIEMVISIDYTDKILSAREMSFDPQITNEDLLPMEIGRDVIEKAREGNKIKGYEYTIDYFNKPKTLYLQIINIYDWQVDVLVSECRLGEKGRGC